MKTVVSDAFKHKIDLFRYFYLEPKSALPVQNLSKSVFWGNSYCYVRHISFWKNSYWIKKKLAGRMDKKSQDHRIFKTWSKSGRLKTEPSVKINSININKKRLDGGTKNQFLFHIERKILNH